MDPFATVDELAIFLGRPLAGANADRAAAVLVDASAAVRDYCGQSLELVENHSIELSGVWERLLELPERPIVAVSSVAVSGLELALDVDYVVTTEGLRRTRGHWGGPRGTVVVTYSHGLAAGSPSLATVKGITLAVASRSIENPSGLVQESVGSYSVTYGSRTGAGALTRAEKARLRSAGLARRVTTTITRSPLAS